MRLALALAVALALPGTALAAETSPGVSLVGSIPERGVISARAVGQHLYVSALSGMSIYDVSDPRAPVRVGRLELPNAQNEDVDVGSGIMLVSDDPVGGRGILHVIDVSDPAAPRVLSTYSTRRRCSDTRRRASRTAATHGSRARAKAIEVVDLRDPARPRRAGRFRAREAAGLMGTHDVQVDGSGLAWVAGGNGTAAYDVSDPVHPKLVRRTNRQGSRPPLNKFIHHNSLRLRRNVVAITEEAFGRGCRRAGTLQTWRISRHRRMRPLDTFGVERDRSARLLCSAHYFDARDGLIAQGFYEQGVRLIDARRPRRLRQVGYYVNRPGLFWGALFAPTDPSGSTVYALDHSRGIDVLALDRAALRPVRRKGSRPRGPLNADSSMFILSPFSVRPGQRISIGLLRVRLPERRRGPGDAAGRAGRRPPAERRELRSRDADAAVHPPQAQGRAASARAGRPGHGAWHGRRDDRIRHCAGRRAAARRPRRRADVRAAQGRAGAHLVAARFLQAPV